MPKTAPSAAVSCDRAILTAATLATVRASDAEGALTGVLDAVTESWARTA
ncbi:hypothetical protein KEC56_02495 [Microbacterium sp. YMB-B2]|uniref:Uncharacterized protein n=1 Tax=Microbacterium tenebrionis TaxID=2830665 RepID=A0A9X1LMI3_9MICO|nr:hypothetical protein [Microbacterium tenebrionis]MCC2028405.1 hypothetical protein [Microbacterium tenebrionis]